MLFLQPNLGLRQRFLMCPRARVAAAERPCLPRSPAAERRLTVWPIGCLEGDFPYKIVNLSHAHGVGEGAAAMYVEAAPRQCMWEPLRGNVDRSRSAANRAVPQPSRK